MLTNLPQGSLDLTTSILFEITMAPVLDTVHYNARMSLIYDAWSVRIHHFSPYPAIEKRPARAISRYLVIMAIYRLFGHLKWVIKRVYTRYWCPRNI